tara:strand:- start:56 stop:193 length:138 start_codon:yes stop_codon:yes gene_type:complete
MIKKEWIWMMSNLDDFKPSKTKSNKLLKLINRFKNYIKWGTKKLK